MRIGRGALIRGLIGIAISVVAIVILLRSIDVAEVVAILRGASPAWIAVMVVATLIDIGARGARWQALLAPIAAVAYRRVLGYTYIGYLANNILPARLVGLGLGMAAHRLPGADRVVAFLERWPRIVELGRRLRDGLRVAGKPRTLAAAIVFSALAWGASITTFLAGGQAVGIHLTLAQGALVATGVALATIVPSGPGFVGTFELTAAAIITPFGVDHDTAVAMAVLVHATILVVTS